MKEWQFWFTIIGAVVTALLMQKDFEDNLNNRIQKVRDTQNKMMTSQQVLESRFDMMQKDVITISDDIRYVRKLLMDRYAKGKPIKYIDEYEYASQ